MSSNLVYDLRTKRNKFAMTIGTALLIIAIVIVVVGGVVSLYKTYKGAEVTEKVLTAMVQHEYYIDMNMSDNSSIGFNASKGGRSLGIINGKEGSVKRIIGYPRNSLQEYYRSPNGNVTSPYSLELQEA